MFIVFLFIGVFFFWLNLYGTLFVTYLTVTKTKESSSACVQRGLGVQFCCRDGEGGVGGTWPLHSRSSISGQVRPWVLESAGTLGEELTPVFRAVGCRLVIFSQNLYSTGNSVILNALPIWGAEGFSSCSPSCKLFLSLSGSHSCNRT